MRTEEEVNQLAYDRMCQLHDELAALGISGAALERALIQLLVCLFADDSGVFAPKAFAGLVRTRTRPDGGDLGMRLDQLFAFLGTPAGDLSETLAQTFAGFRSISGDLFSAPLPLLPAFRRSTRSALLAATELPWARVSPVVFGSLLQGALDKGARRQQGAHYTSERDVLKVVRPLFLDSLAAELAAASHADGAAGRATRLRELHRRLRTLRFLDPACGCGDFLVVAYRELRRLELALLKQLCADGEPAEAPDPRGYVDASQFYGIELAAGPARIAEVAMWVVERQMNQELSATLGSDASGVRSCPRIVVGNALRLAWEQILPPSQCSYILGNPPFIGKHLLNQQQQQDMALVWGGLKGAGFLDYVSGWYRKAAEYIAGTRIQVAFVSTSSITQGEQVGLLWNELYSGWHLKIHFAHRTFSWTSQARGAAHVHVVIVGFGAFDVGEKYIWDYERGEAHVTVFQVSNISPYLLDGPDVALPIRRRPLCRVPAIVNGNKPSDGGSLLVSADQRAELLAKNPSAASYLRPFVSAEEYLSGQTRWVLWLADVPAQAIQSNPWLHARVQEVRRFRAASRKAATRRRAEFPALFDQIRQPTAKYILIPRHSSERREYVPLAYFEPDVIIGDSCTAIPDATPYHFGVLSSAMHMAWLRAVCGRLESRYRYSNKLVYNNFPWPAEPAAALRAAVESAARTVLETRQRFLPPAGKPALAELYDPRTMPTALRRAHDDLDRAVERCYRGDPFPCERERAQYLFGVYAAYTG